MHPFDLTPPMLEQGLRRVEQLAQGPIVPPDAPYAQIRALLLEAMEGYSVALAHHLTPFLEGQDDRRNIALIRQIDARQSLSLLPLTQAQPRSHQSLLLGMLALELSAVLAQRLGDGPVRQALNFTLPEFLDEIYRLSNLMLLIEGKTAHQLLGGYVEIMPGRPLLACQRHPYDGVMFPQTPESVLEEMAALMMCAVTDKMSAHFQDAAAHSDQELARALYGELALVTQQHHGLFSSLLARKDPLERLLLCQYTEGYLYDSCARDEEGPALRQLYLEERDHELAHIRKVSDMLEKAKGETPSLPPFPDCLRLGPNKGYVRDMLQYVGMTRLREHAVSVGELAQGADFFRFQQRLFPEPEKAPSHRVISQIIEKTGEDYRFEIAQHPIEALRNRQKDNLQVGR